MGHCKPRRLAASASAATNVRTHTNTHTERPSIIRLALWGCANELAGRPLLCSGGPTLQTVRRAHMPPSVRLNALARRPLAIGANDEGE